MSMKEAVYQLSGVRAIVVQNGVETSEIRRYASVGGNRDRITSIRGFTPLYRIDEIIDARDRQVPCTPLTFVYPFRDGDYYETVKGNMGARDEDLGRLGKEDLYRLLAKTLLTISIPSSDSSPRSVYEAIFAGSSVAANYNSYMESMPSCMRDRIFVVDFEDENWFKKALTFAEGKSRVPYQPSDEALEQYDQRKSLQAAVDRIYG
jgi:hypothetical protein